MNDDILSLWHAHRQVALPDVPRRPHELRAGRPRHLGCAVARVVVGHDQPRAWKRLAQRGERLPQPIRLVVGAHHDSDFR